MVYITELSIFTIKGLGVAANYYALDVSWYLGPLEINVQKVRLRLPQQRL